MRLTRNILVLLAVALLSAPAFSQYDDLYYNPDKDQNYYSYDDGYVQDRSTSYASARQEDLDRYSDEDEYDYYNDYDFYYTSRIRRFHRPLYGFGYYDPVYTDAYYYDPFIVPGNTVLIYDDFFSYRDWVRWRNWRGWGWSAARFNRWDLCWGGGGFGFNTWGWDPFWGNRWYQPGININIGIGFNRFGFNNWGWDPFWGARGFGWGGGWFNGYPNPYWAGNRWGGYYNYAPGWSNGNEYNRDIYYGPRTGGSATGPAPGLRNRNNGINPGTIGNNGRNMDARRDLNDRVTPNPNDRINTGVQRDRNQVEDRSRNTRIDGNTTTTPTRIRTTSPRTRTSTTSEQARTRTNTTGSNSSQSRERNSNGHVENRRIGGQVIPVTPNNYPDRTERYRRPSRSAIPQTAPSTRNSGQSYDRSRSTRSYPSYSPTGNRSSNQVRSTVPSRSRSSIGSSSSTRSSVGSSRGSSSIQRSGSSSSGSRSSSSSAGRKRGGSNE